MAKYKYRIVNNYNWRFELLPNNSDEFYVGYSCDYQTKDEVLNGLNNFKNFLRKKSDFTCEYEGFDNENLYRAYFVFSDKKEIFYTRKYRNKYEPKKGIERIKNNFDVDIKEKLKI